MYTHKSYINVNKFYKNKEIKMVIPYSENGYVAHFNTVIINY